MQKLLKSIRTNAELKKVYSDIAELTKIHSDKCRTYKSPFGQIQNLQKLVGNLDNACAPTKTSIASLSRQTSIYLTHISNFTWINVI